MGCTGNSSASRIWKGNIVLNKFILLSAFLIFPALLFSEAYVFSLDNLRSEVDSVLVAETMISHNSQWFSAVSLLEVLPLMEEVYSMTIRTGESVFQFDDDDLAEYWADSYFIREGNDLNLIFKEKIYYKIEQLSFQGTPMVSSSLEVWLSWEGVDLLKEELHHFALRHNLNIKAVEVPRPESKLISLVRAGGDVPDLIMLQSSAVENLVQSRSIQNLNYIRLPLLIEQGAEAFSLDNKLWAVPFYFDTQLMYYNTKLVTLSDETLWTLEEMERAASAIKTSGIYPLAWNAYSSNWLIPYQVSFGKAELIDTYGKITVNDSATEDALKYIIGLKEKELLSPMERDAMDALFIAGKVGIIMSGSYAIPYFESLSIDFGVLPYPVNQETGLPVSPLLDFKAFAITRKTRAPILARRVIQYLIAAGVQQRFCPELAKLPVRKDVLHIPGLSYGYLDILEEASESGTVIPPQNVYGIYKNNMWKLLRFALSGKMSVEQTLEQGQRLMDNTIGN